MPISTGRDVSLDAVRLLGIVAIVAGHSLEGDTAREVLYTWHVPVFFFLSGYLWKTGRTLKDEAWRRAETLLVPYLFWLAAISVVFIPYVFATDGTNEAIKRSAGVVLGGYFLKIPYQAFWFVTALFVACLIYRALDNRWKNAILWLLPTAVALTFAGEWLKLIPEAAGLALPALAFIGLGRLARTASTRWATASLGAVLLVGVALLTWADINEPLDIKRGDFGVPVLGIACAAAASWGLVLVARPLLARAPRVVSSSALSLSTLGLAAVLTHGVAVDLLLDRVDAWAVFVISLAFGFAVAWLVSMTPLRGWALGTVNLRAKARLRR